MTMRKLMVAVCFALLAGGAVYAQDGEKTPRREWNPEMIAKRMSGRLMLNDEVSAKFVPLYQEYLQKLAECRPQRTEKGEKEVKTDEEIDQNIKARFDTQEKCLKVEVEYYEKFKDILTMRQVEQLYKRPQAPARNRPQGARQPSRDMRR